MKNAYRTMAFTLVLIGHVQILPAQQAQSPSTDADLRKLLVGAWSIDELSPNGNSRSLGTNIFTANGTFVEYDRTFPIKDPSDRNATISTSTGTWQFKDGYLTMTYLTLKATNRVNGVVMTNVKIASTTPDGRLIKPFANRAKITLVAEDQISCISKTLAGTDRPSTWKRIKAPAATREKH